MYEQILDQLEQLLKQEIKDFGGDFVKAEQGVMLTVLSLGKGLLQRIVDHGNNGYQGSSLSCQCGGSMRFIQHRPRDIHTLLGWIRLKRAYYHCPNCSSASVPYDKASGIGAEQLSPALAKACCMLAVDDSFEQVSRKLEQLFGQQVSDTTIERMMHRVGSVAVKEQKQQLQEFFNHKEVPEPQANPERLYVSLDGTTAHETDGWHEAKVGCIYWGNQPSKHDKRYVASFDDSETFGWHLWMEACRCGLRGAKELVYLGDGAGWIRTEHHRHFGRATFIIDWYHASEHIWDCGKVLFGEGTEGAKQWVEQRLDWLYDGCTKRLLDDLKQQRKKYRGCKRETIERLYRYISVNEEQMRYDIFRENGYDIGSGAVEGACKNVVGKRLKQSGMIWTRLGSSSVLALRAIWLNHRWEQLWLRKPLAA
jgi:hypothetical protein